MNLTTRICSWSPVPTQRRSIPLIGSRIINAKERGAKLLLIDPREIQLAGFADLHLRQNIGTDVAVLNGMMNIIIEEDLYDKEFVETRTEGFDAAEGRSQPLHPAGGGKDIRDRRHDLEKAARMYAEIGQGDDRVLRWASPSIRRARTTSNPARTLPC